MNYGQRGRAGNTLSARPARRPFGRSVMPWSADDMKAKGCKRNCGKAAAIANAVLRGGGSEVKAIRTALAWAKHSKEK